MNRRSFLRGAVLGSALTTAPNWFAKAWAAPRHGTHRVFDAYRKARRHSRALLVFVIPDKREERYERGGSLGAYLNHGSDQQLAPLALCEVVCATMEELHTLSPASYTSEPSFVLLETLVVPAKPRHQQVSFGKAAYNTSDAEVDENTANIAKAIRQLVMPHDAVSASMLKGRDISAEKAILKSIANTPNKVKLAQVDRNAPGLMQAALKLQGKKRASIIAALAATAIARIRDKPVAGARWAHAAVGCGPTLYEDEPDKKDDESGIMIGCGMGHVPAKSERFLAFLVEQQK